MTQLTKTQCAIVTAHGHLLVDAGAGSGKTTTVVQTICHQMGIPVNGSGDGAPLEPVSTPLTLDQLAAITFTNHAAADLKRKLRASLRSAGRSDLAADVDAARIGTIHGFCGDLLRDYALRARLRPGRRVLSDSEATAIVADCARAALHATIADGNVAGLPDLLATRRLKDITEWVTRAASDTDRLDRWAANRGSLRDHERALLDIALRAMVLRTEHLANEGLIDFDRMLGAARDLLRDPDVRHAVQRQIRLLVVDEFQDVDPVQRDIAELLAGIAEPDDDPSRLILVGDPKQSIYRFRRADVTLWNGIAARFREGAGRVLPLNENFRSKAAILGFVDHVVGKLLDVPVDEGAGRQAFEVDYAALEAAVADHAGDLAVELQVVPADAGGKAVNASTARSLDAAGTARRIRELHAEGRGYGDIAILLAGWGSVDTYESALRTAGIPVYVQRGEGFWERREVLDCVLALRALRDPSDEVAMVGFLKSPFVGVKDETLLALAAVQHDGALSERPVPERPVPERALLDRAAALLSTFGALRDRLDTAELLRRLLMESGYLAVAALAPDGAQRTANLRKLLRLAAESPTRSLGEFLREVQEVRGRQDKIPPEPLYREHSDVVTITSIHGAKGLEWPVVFWCDLVRETPAEKGAFCVARDTFSIEQPTDEEEGDARDPRHQALVSAVEQEKLAETYRLWYVATTRAKERLILSGLPLGKTSPRMSSPARKILGLLGDLTSVRQLEYRSASGESYHAVVRKLDTENAEVSVPPGVQPALPVAPSRIAAPTGAARLSASQLMAFARDPAQWHRDHVDRFSFRGVGAPTSTRGVTRAVRTGQVVHDVLERIGDDDVDVMALIEDAIGVWDEDAHDRASDAGSVLRAALGQRVDAALASPAWREVAGAPGARRELWFTRVLQDGTVINGALDLVAGAAAGAVAGVRILDVKTGSSGAAASAERYEIQAAVYTDAVRAITGVAHVTFALLSLPSGTVVDVEPTTDVAALVQRLRTLPRPRAQSISRDAEHQSFR